MPRYYFDNRDGEKLVPDDTGVVLPSIEQARDQAAQALAELAKDVLAGSIHRELATEIRNEAGEPLLRATLVLRLSGSGGFLAPAVPQGVTVDYE
jgi:hypothetical protein